MTPAHERARQDRAGEGVGLVPAQRDRPIIFSASMVRALLDGRKRMTRRVLKPQPNMLNGGLPLNDGRGSYSTADGWKRYTFVAGQRLWVKEAYAAFWGPRHPGGSIVTRASVKQASGDYAEASEANPLHVHYAAGPQPEYGPDRWKSPIFCPRWASRLTLIVEAVKVERLADISDADARAEGFEAFGPDIACPYQDGPTGDAADAFSAYWDSLHGKGAFEASPWVAAIAFRVIPQNIDSLPQAEGPRL